jgi:UPF0271 protein
MGKLRIDLNCDMGEGFGAFPMGSDDEVLPFITSANLACGFHGGDPRVMDRMVFNLARAGVAIGAHPSHYDLRGFGRRVIQVEPEEIEADVVYQVGALAAFTASHRTRLRHVKPHGALYNQAADDAKLAAAVARGVARIDRELVLVGLAGSVAMREAARAEGLRFAAEAFADRVYESDGRLRSRRERGAVILDAQVAAAQAVRIAREREVEAHGGSRVPLEADTLCLHGDNPRVDEIAWTVRQALEQAGIEVRAIGA